MIVSVYCWFVAYCVEKSCVRELGGVRVTVWKPSETMRKEDTTVVLVTRMVIRQVTVMDTGPVAVPLETLDVQNWLVGCVTVTEYKEPPLM